MSYTLDYFTARETWRDWRVEARLLTDLARLAPAARVLEIGCGGGGLLKHLGECGASAVGIETSQQALTAARTRGFQLVHVGQSHALPFCAGSFDAILGQHVVEHLPDVPAMLSECSRVLKPGGRLVLATPNAHYPDPAHFADTDHNHIYAPDELCEIIGRTGFVVENCSTVFPFLSHSRALRGLGVVAHDLFRRTPYFSTHGRTIILAAQKL